MSDALDEIAVTSPDHDRLAADRDALAAELTTTNLRILATTNRALELDAERDALIGLRDRTTARITKLRTRSETIQRSLRKAAVQRYVSGAGDNLYPDPNETIEERLVKARMDTISGRGLDRAIAAKATVDANRTSLSEALSKIDSAVVKNEADRTRTTKEHDEAVTNGDRLTLELVTAEISVRDARANATVVGTDLPLLALDGYWRAAQRLVTARPTCGIQWWALAGIGRSESNHGRASGGALQRGGNVSVPIYGIALDGTNGTQVIPDSDAGKLDGDPTLDRAVGIMQFIPGTWRRYAADNSGDKVADPQNMYDAAVTAGNYLCTYGPDLDAEEGLRKAYFGYNHSDPYVQLVLDRALGYRDAVGTMSADGLLVPPAPNNGTPADPTTADSTAAATPTTVPAPR